MRKKTASGPKRETPIFDLRAFSQKATWTHFYIERINDHIKEHEFIGKPHKHDFYLILFVSNGKGVHVIDFVKYDVKPNSIFLMTPGQVHSWNLSKDIEGFVIFFTREFYEMQLSRNSLLEFPFYHSLSSSPLIRPPKIDVVEFITGQMFEEYKGIDSPNLRMLRAYLDILLLEAAKYYDTPNVPKTHGNTFRIRKLEQLIHENFRTLKQPAGYGDLMNLAPGYLNKICKDTLGKTLTDLLQERMLLEAKRMFAYSDLHVNEVAANLNFADPSYFIRWFRKLSGMTPEDFRKSMQESR